MRTNLYNQGQSLVGIVIVLVIVGLIGGSLYYYLLKQTPGIPKIEAPEITKESIEETSEPEEEEIVEVEVPEEITPEVIPPEKEPTLPPGPEKLVIQKCVDGTPYGQCSINKPKYCDNGNLVDRVSLCGCPSDYEVYSNECIKKLAGNCGIIHEGTKNYSKAINFVIVPADLSYTSYINDPDAQYSNDFSAFITDANKNVNDFLSVDPVNKYKTIFNFYYATDVIKCTLPGDRVVCNLWKEAADNCNIPYDEVIILQRKEGGGTWGGPWIQSSSYTTTTFTHEIGHDLGFRDYDNLFLPVGPNHCVSLGCCGGTLCQFQHWSEQKPIELGGPDCCLYQGSVESTSFYVPNEQSAMHAGMDYKALKFNRLEKTYLNELFTKISSLGKESVRCGIFFKTAKYCQ